MNLSPITDVQDASQLSVSSAEPRLSGASTIDSSFSSEVSVHERNRIAFKRHISEVGELIGGSAVQNDVPKTLKPTVFLNPTSLLGSRSHSSVPDVTSANSAKILSCSQDFVANSSFVNKSLNMSVRGYSSSTRSTMTSQSLCYAFQMYQNRHQPCVSEASPSTSHSEPLSSKNSQTTSQGKTTASSHFSRNWRSVVSMRRGNDSALFRGATSSAVPTSCGVNSCSSGEDSSQVDHPSDDSGDSMCTQPPMRVKRTNIMRKRASTQLPPLNRNNFSDSGYSSSNLSGSSSMCSSFTPWTDKIISQEFQPLQAQAPDMMPIPLGSVPQKTMEAMSPGLVSPLVEKEHQLYSSLQPGLDSHTRGRTVHPKRSLPDQHSEAKRSRPQAREHRFRRTADALQESGLWEVAMQTGHLIKRNKALQKELDEFKVQSLNFLKSVLKNPQNKKLIKQVLNSTLLQNPPNKKWSLISAVMTTAFKLGASTLPPTDHMPTDANLPMTSDVKGPMPTPLTVPNPTSINVPMSTTTVPILTSDSTFISIPMSRPTVPMSTSTVPYPDSINGPIATTTVPMPTLLNVPIPTFFSDPVPAQLSVPVTTPLTIPMPPCLPVPAAVNVTASAPLTAPMLTPLTVPVPNTLKASSKATSTVVVSSNPVADAVDIVTTLSLNGNPPIMLLDNKTPTNPFSEIQSTLSDSVLTNSISDSMSTVPLSDSITTIQSNLDICPESLPSLAEMCADVLKDDIDVAVSGHNSSSLTADLSLDLPTDFVEGLPPDITVSLPLDVGCSMSIGEECGVCSQSVTGANYSAGFIDPDFDGQHMELN